MLPFGVGLAILAHVIDPAELVRAPEHLQAAVFPRRPVERNVDAHHVGRETAVVVPISEVLVPFPGAALVRLLHGHLVTVEIDRLADGVLGEVHHAFVARQEPVLVVPGLRPHFQERRLALPVGLRHDRAVTLFLFELRPGAPAEPIDLFRAQKAPAEQVPVAGVALRLVRAHGDRHLQRPPVSGPFLMRHFRRHQQRPK